MDFPKLKSIIEGLLFLAGDEGLTVKQIAEIVDHRPELVEDALKELKEDFERQQRGIQVMQIALAATSWRRLRTMPPITKNSPIRLPVRRCPRQRWKRWRSSLTVSRSRAWKSKRSAGSNRSVPFKPW